LAIQFIVADSIAESPIFEGDEEWTEGGIVQFHHQFQKYFCHCCFKVLDRLKLVVYNLRQTLGFKDGLFRISKILRNISNNSLEEPVRSSRVPAAMIQPSTVMNISRV